MTHPNCFVKQLTFNDNSKIDVNRDSIVVFVGANNSGKSRSLKDIGAKVESVHNSSVVVCAVDINIDNAFDYWSYLGTVARRTSTSGGGCYYSGLDFRFYTGEIGDFQKRKDYGSAAPCFFRHLLTDARLAICQPPDSVSRDEQPQHPIHLVARDAELRKTISRSFFEAFSFYLVPDPLYGRKIPLWCVPLLPTMNGFNGKDELEREDAFYSEIRKFSMLHEQGDGMRSFAGILLNLALPYVRTFCIDEPEAFLHPPQAKIMGEMIAKLLNRQQQAFIATHSESIVKGLMEAAPDRVKVVRIVREGVKNRVSKLDSAELLQFWRDPILRYSNIMSGMFYNKTVVCESDSDCKLYSAMDSHLKGKEGKFSEALFVAGGGKHRLPVIAKALLSLKIDYRIIADIDVLDDENVFKSVVESVGVKWDEVLNDYKVIVENLRAQREKVPRGEIVELLNNITGQEGTYLADGEVGRIKDCIKTESKWSLLKKGGVPIIPSGEPTQAWHKLDLQLKKHGLYIVPVGELENFVKEVGNSKLHGPKWVDKVLHDYPNLDDEVYKQLKDFVESLQV